EAGADKAREEDAALAQEEDLARSRLARIREETAALGQRGGRGDAEGQAQENAGAIKRQRGEVAQLEAAVRDSIAVLFRDRSPQELIEAWDDSIPILLLPLRLETRWKTGPEVRRQELWLRVYPDDVAVNTHEKVLTDAEVIHGRAYWTNLRAAADAEARTAAWRTLADRFSANRAAWVALQTKPANWAAAALDPALALDFPPAPLTKPDAWTEAPHTRVLPDRFVVLGWRGTELKLVEVGAPVDDVVVLGPSPLEDPEGGPGVSRDAVDRTLALGASFAWVRDFDDAVRRGMAFRIAVDADTAAHGYDRLIVLGLKHSADDGDAKTLVEELIDNHHYARPGFALVRQGTATNNTSGDDSGYTRAGRDGDGSVTEVGQDLFTPVADRAAARDGQRLADFLGIGYEPLLHADGAELADHAEAVAMNRALYAGTLGYFLDHMLNEVVDEGALAGLRAHFTSLVTGRGPIAAIRVGAQPYGILPTSAFPRWRPSLLARERISTALFPDPFETVLHRVLARFDQAWSAVVPRLAKIGNAGEGAAHLLDVLGLHPTSEELYQRVGYSYDTLANMESLVWGGHEFRDSIDLLIEGLATRALLVQLGYQPRRADGSDKPLPLLLQLVWRHYHTMLDRKQVIDGQPLSETDGIKPYDAASGKTYLDWLLEHAADAAALEAQDFGRAPRPSSLLYMLLHFALAMEAGRGVHLWLAARGVQADELVRSRKFLNVGPSPSPSPWEVFRAPASRIVRGETDRPLLELVHAPQLAGGVGRGVAEQRAGLEVLRGMPTARLERALVEHVDTLSYRLDAWQTSLFTRRLHRQRRLDAPVGERRTGVYLGAYGYLEHLRPPTAEPASARAPRRRTRVADDSLPRELRQGAENLFAEAGNAGYVHAPSMAHATAAALLRNGYLTHATPDQPESLAVNLSSERVRRARYLLDGVRNGQSLEVLLGVQFERGMHDWTTRHPSPVILDQLKPAFRAAFPIRRTRVPQAASGAGAATVNEDHQVVNGLDLARTTIPFPWGVAGLGGLSAEQRSALEHEKDNIANTLDALRDVLTAEAAYQLALGNFDRAAAVVQSIGNGTVPPDVEVVRTPRGTSLSFTNRLAIHLSPAVAGNPWAADVPALTQRALLEPALNHWLGTLIPDPANVRCAVEARAAADGPLLAAGTVSLADLGVQPIDLVYMARSQPQQSSVAELESRIRIAFAQAHGIADDAVVRVAFASTGGDAGARPFSEVLPLADRLRRLLGAARPLHARHFQSASKDAPAPPDNPGKID
ncbi:MAG TPA: hypothetical protein VF771_16825, partial [Longimicrobiaceae bacterium]